MVEPTRQQKLFSHDPTKGAVNATANDVNYQNYEIKSRRTDLLRKRNLILWELPHLGNEKFIEMYINPQNMQFSSKKEIQKIRTKGGYITQYWGEDLDTINIGGTTGDAGIEGINVLRDIYRSEQLALVNIVRSQQDKRRQSLMQLAASVIMWYQGQGYRGYFTDMSYTEAAATPGLFTYSMNFVVTEIIGRRSNFMQWHRIPWSTTDHPTQLKDGETQAEKGGGYRDGQKIGVLNIPPHEIETIIRISPTDSSKNKVVTVAILRGDLKDPDSKKLGAANTSFSASGQLAQGINDAVAKSIDGTMKNATNDAGNPPNELPASTEIPADTRFDGNLDSFSGVA